MPKKQEGQRGSTTVTKDGRVRTVFFLDPELRRTLKVAAAEREETASELVSQALRRFLDVD